jgi:AmpD protein
VNVDASHWLTGAERRHSPNCDDRPDPRDISLVVVHCISLPPGRFGTGLVTDLFLGRLDCSRHEALADLAGVRVSAHVFVERDGRVLQFVPFDRRAWHAGVSSFRGRAHCNDYSIGIELEGTDEAPYADVQYAALVAVLSAVRAAYPRVTLGAIVGHCDVAPGRKSDPGRAFDWTRLLRELVVR